MKRTLSCLWMILLMGAVVASAEPDSGRYVLNPDSQSPPRLLTVGESLSAEPTFEVQWSDVSGCLLDFHFPALLMEELIIEGERFGALTIPGGGMSGLAGEPGLPTYSGLLAVPEGSAVEVSGVVQGQRKFSNVRVFPVQPDDGAGFVLNAAAYSGGSAGGQVAGKKTDQDDASKVETSDEQQADSTQDDKE